jgi:hypothetical protein
MTSVLSLMAGIVIGLLALIGLLTCAQLLVNWRRP